MRIGVLGIGRTLAGERDTLTVANTVSLAEQIQRAHPDALVVKTLNTMSCDVMVEPDRVAGDHVAFLCGTTRTPSALPRI